MPTRLIREGILSSEVVNQLTWAEEVFFRRLLSVADDYGLYDARETILRASLYPLRLDRVSNRDIQKWHARCEALGLVKVYEVDSRRYGQIVKYGQQSKSAPKHPIPPGANPADFRVKPKKSQAGVTDCTEPLRPVTVRHLDGVGDEGVNKNMVVGSSTVCVGPCALPATTPPHSADGDDEGFRHWLEAVKAAHPSARQSHQLALDVQSEAQAAYARCPQAAEHAALLTAYMDDRLQRDCNRKPFYRPSGQAKFFANLEDVLAHAFRWAKEMSWTSGKRRRRASAADNAQTASSPPPQSSGHEDEAERARILSEIIEMVNESPYEAARKKGKS